MRSAPATASRSHRPLEEGAAWAGLARPAAQLGMLLLLAAYSAPAAAQQAPDQGEGQPPSRELLEPLPVSPGGAFLRSVLLPGWGHVAIGSYSRAGFYFTLESATVYAFLRTRRRLSEARDRATLRENVVRADLAAQGITDPEEVQSLVDQDERLGSFQDLVESREGQEEDLIAWGIFLLFLSGADAYVSTHLARFPAPIEIQAAPVDSDRAEVSLRIALPNFP